jgi:glutathione S-transferase-like protein
MYTLYYSPGSASMAPHGVLEESGAPYALARVDMAANKHKDAAHLKLNPPMQMDTRYPNVARCAGLVADRPAIMRALQQNQAA